MNVPEVSIFGNLLVIFFENFFSNYFGNWLNNLSGKSFDKFLWSPSAISLQNSFSSYWKVINSHRNRPRNSQKNDRRSLQRNSEKWKIHGIFSQMKPNAGCNMQHIMQNTRHCLHLYPTTFCKVRHDLFRYCRAKFLNVMEISLTSPSKECQ